LNADPLKIRQINLYKKNDVTPTGQPLPNFIVDDLINKLIVSSDYSNRVKAIIDFNKNNRWKKKGISMTPIK
jgi:xanthine dehydrogenase/oxidase